MLTKKNDDGHHSRNSLNITSGTIKGSRGEDPKFTIYKIQTNKQLIINITPD